MKIKLSELRQMVKSIIKEEQETIGTTQNFYWDENEKSLVFKLDIIKEKNLNNGNIFITTSNPKVSFNFSCKNKKFYYELLKYSNKAYADILYKKYCGGISKVVSKGISDIVNTKLS
jgi:hypothetical protein